MYKIGEIIKVKGIDCLVLDFIDGNPFVVALDTGISTEFDSDCTDYRGSTLKEKCDNWFRKLNVKTVPRIVNFTAMDGCKKYGNMPLHVAPLTFDEYRKYSSIIKPHIKKWFWTVTPWGDPDIDNWASDFVCIVGTGGSAYDFGYIYTGGRLAPAFILDKNYLNEPDPSILESFQTEALLAEIALRVK